MRLQTIARIVVLSTVLPLLACKDTTASGPASENSLSQGPPSALSFERLPTGCKREQGDVTLTLVPSNDPFGRTVGPSKGGLNGAATSRIERAEGGPGGQIALVTEDSWVLGPTDAIFSDGLAYLAPISGGDFTVDMTQTITGGTGKYDGVTGTIHLLGVGYRLTVGVGLGTTYYDLHYDGTICT